MSRAPITALAQQRLDEVDRGNTVSVDLQLDLVDERDGAMLGRFGGRWSRERKDYVEGDAPISRVMRMHPGQVDAAKWFVEWIDKHLAGDPLSEEERIFDMFLTGGRRGGKSAIAFVLAVIYALAVPGSIVWIVCASDSYFGEPLDYLLSIMPPEWFTYLGWPHFEFTLANGSTIVLRSGHTPGMLKQGRADFVLINEGQRVKTQSYQTLSASIVDNGGLIVTTANPPDVGDPGEWVADMVGKIESGEDLPAVHFFFDPLNNPHIVQSALRALAKKYDKRTFDVQVRGMYLLHPDSVMHAWDRSENERPPPEMAGADITAAFTKHFEGTAYHDIVGIDVQNFPWIAGVRFRAYRNPLARDDVEMALLWAVGEVFVDQGDEVHAVKALRAIGCRPESTLIVADASCFWQQQQRDQSLQREKYRGQGSADVFKGEGWTHVVPPDTDMKANPSIVDRMRAANARIGPAEGPRMLFVDPTRCPKTVESLRKWRTRPDGTPSRRSKFAHAGDAFTYAVWRFFPRRIETSSVDVQTIKRTAGASRLKGF
jgi:hypothetical protein